MFNLVKRNKIKNPFGLIDSLLSDRWLQTMVPGNAFPVVDIQESESTVFINVELPGVSREDVKLFLEDGKLTITGEKKRVFETGKSDSGETCHRTERVYGSFSRTFILGEQIKEDSIGANFENGVLRIFLEKKEPEKPQRKKIEIL
ncbi:MAG: heat-shock protein Hsp20 [Candidatus Wallbacteria bacterium HGW-Wallbacteria-1]|uniref:Heat-shock protein Hsp20 n=1 Tax=Candidatus Wallbacteria bacterium HGW-Wallbacteria-1 TaxID=2013854 RepID=A0A2N1PRX8_9BACT|nr:MAG: heat-shock protein Hsp20 [Candidatus Wallbacteria bacterium HGW-Wallbacteria-1]